MQPSSHQTSMLSISVISRRHRTIVIVCVLLVLLLPIGLRAARRRAEQRPVSSQLNGQLRDSQAMSRLMVQQLDEMFDVLATAINARGGQPTSDERALLQRWKNYDEQFLQTSRKTPSNGFVRSVTHYRIGLIQQILGDDAAALIQFQKAIAILEDLAAQEPGVRSYHGDSMHLHVFASRALARSGDVTHATQHMQEALRLIQLPTLRDLPGIPELKQQLTAELLALKSSVNQSPAELHD